MPNAKLSDTAERPPQRVPAVERVLDHILNELDAGRLQPGGPVNAARVAATLDLSVAPVREALSILSGRGVVDLLPDRGAVIRQLTPTEVVQIWHVATPVAVLGLDLAASAIVSGADPSHLVARYEAILDSPRAVSALQFFYRANEYQWAAHDLAGNRYLTLAMECLGVAYWDRYLAKLIDVHANIDGYLNNYRRMHEAVMAGDGTGAGEVFRFHAAWSIELIRKGTMDAVSLRRRRRTKIASEIS
jgi:DNA-binding GntR family transcriptional regulator